MHLNRIFVEDFGIQENGNKNLLNYELVFLLHLWLFVLAVADIHAQYANRRPGHDT